MADSTKANIAYGMQVMKDLGLTTEQFFGMVGSVMGESGRGLDPNAFNPKDPDGGAFGMFQHVGSRRRALAAFAKKAGTAMNDFRTQWEFVKHELQTTEKAALTALKRATNRKEAARIWTKTFERPAEATAGHEKRAANADYAARLMGVGGDTPVSFGSGGGDMLATVTDSMGREDGGPGSDGSGTGTGQSGSLGELAGMLGMDVGTAADQGPMTPGQGLAMTLGALVGGPSGIKLAGQLFGTSADSTPQPLTGAEAISMSLGGLLGGIPGAMLGQAVGKLFGPKETVVNPDGTVSPASGGAGLLGGLFGGGATTGTGSVGSGGNNGGGGFGFGGGAKENPTDGFGSGVNAGGGN